MKTYGVFEGKTLYFCGGGRGWLYFNPGWLSLVKIYFCRWLTFSKMQFFGYPSFKWDLVGC